MVMEVLLLHNMVKAFLFWVELHCMQTASSALASWAVHASLRALHARTKYTPKTVVVFTDYIPVQYHL
jgi:cell division protein FtsB